MTNLDFSTLLWIASGLLVSIIFFAVVEFEKLSFILAFLMACTLIEGAILRTTAEDILLEKEKKAESITINLDEIMWKPEIRLKYFTYRGYTIKYFVQGELLIRIRNGL